MRKDEFDTAEEKASLKTGAGDSFTGTAKRAYRLYYKEQKAGDISGDYKFPFTSPGLRPYIPLDGVGNRLHHEVLV